MLREVGLVSRTVAAQQRVYRLDPRRLADIADWATRQHGYPSGKLDALEAHLLERGREERG